jgi:hypothetical protein
MRLRRLTDEVGIVCAIARAASSIRPGQLSSQKMES